MKDLFYLFVFSDGAMYEMNNAVSFKDAIWETAKHIGEASDLLRKSLNGFDDEDTEGIVNLYNHFAYTPVDKIFLIDSLVYDDTQGKNS